MPGKWENLREGLTGMVIMTASLLTPFLNNRRRKWGATEAEIQRDYPGDDLVKNTKGEYLHAITINVPAAEIWPWLVQIGQDRGGFYSYELLENIIGCKILNADKIVPEYQYLKAGDTIPMHPSMGCPYVVVSMEPERYLILLQKADMAVNKTLEPDDKLPKKYVNMSWLFFLDEQDDGTTRLISRSRNDWNDSFGNTIFYGIFGVPTTEMDRKMLKGIKKRAEKNAKRGIKE
jgi:hypothetical protein